MKEKKPKGKVKIAAVYFLRIIIFLLFFAMCSVPFFVIFDYLAGIETNAGDVVLTVSLSKGITILLGAMYMLTGTWVGWKLRTHSIYNDIYDIDTKTEYHAALFSLQERGRDKGWVNDTD